MSEPSPVSAAFHAAFAQHVLPLFDKLGFAARRWASARPGLLVAHLVRPLHGESTRIELTVWCNSDGDALHCRVDAIETVNGQELRHEVKLHNPWDSRATLNSSVGELRPRESPERLTVTLRFLAGSLGANRALLASRFHALASGLEGPETRTAWESAFRDAQLLWPARHQRDPKDARTDEASVVFASAHLLMLDVTGERVTFRFDTRGFDPSQPVKVSGWCHNSAGVRVATELINGTQRWTFDLAGQLVVPT
jgi:hypothetical protein